MKGFGNSAAYVHHEVGLAPGDFSFSLNLGVGSYTLAVSMFLNEPCEGGELDGEDAGESHNGPSVTLDLANAAYPLIGAVKAARVPEPAA